jgi:hypothetical protein
LLTGTAIFFEFPGLTPRRVPSGKLSGKLPGRLSAARRTEPHQAPTPPGSLSPYASPCHPGPRVGGLVALTLTSTTRVAQSMPPINRQAIYRVRAPKTALGPKGVLSGSTRVCLKRGPSRWDRTGDRKLEQTADHQENAASHSVFFSCPSSRTRPAGSHSGREFSGLSPVPKLRLPSREAAERQIGGPHSRPSCGRSAAPAHWRFAGA